MLREPSTASAGVERPVAVLRNVVCLISKQPTTVALSTYTHTCVSLTHSTTQSSASFAAVLLQPCTPTQTELLRRLFLFGGRRFENSNVVVLLVMLPSGAGRSLSR